KWESQDSANKDKLVVSTIGRDEILSFKEGDWIEVIDDRTDLLGKPGVLVELLNVEGNTLIIKSSTIKDPDNPGASSVSIQNRKNPRIRRWDSAADIKLNTSTWIALEDGVEIKFEEGTFRTGDYWLIPARTAIADIEWPFTQAQLPFGVKHHYALLGILKLTAGLWSVVSDCRSLFPPLTDLTSLFYVSGDGQEAMPGNLLPKSIIVGVSNGQWPVKNASVKFTVVTAGAGSINVPANGIVLTNNEGQASCNWTLGGAGTPPSQQVKAELIDVAGNPMHLPVIFTANHSIASNVLYDDAGCDNWGSDPHNTVAEAITSLCKRKSGKRGCSFTVGREGDFATLFEALNKLAEEGVADICLCLLPNEVHKIDRDIEIRSEKTKTIKISGCNALIEMDEVKVILISGKIILQSFTLRSETIKKSQLFLSAEEIDITNCEFYRLSEDPSTAPFILISPLDEKKVGIIRCDKNKITSRAALHEMEFTDDALTVFTGISGGIENNEIHGIVRLQYNTERFEVLKWDNDQEEATIFRGLTASIKRSSANLIIRANIFENVFTNVFRSPNSDFISVYKNLVISDNLFLGKEIGFIPTDDFKPFQDNSSFLAEFITLCNNHFSDKKDHDEPILCYAMGEAGMITGNIGVNDDRLRIEVKFNRSRIDPTLVVIT
ncbi:MAG TPA: DUF6519 domain-containing protein, partial [Chryseolinea sp.]|nr:DUF6519 domain-containing protein [Chryseolinea sp.]